MISCLLSSHSPSKKGSALKGNADIMLLMFVCVAVLWPSQPNRLMPSVVSLPNHILVL